MKTGLSQTLGLRTELKLQPRQILCNELLTLPLLDLEAALQTELEENIFLEAEERQERVEEPPELMAPVQMTPPGGDIEPGAGGEAEEVQQDPGRLSDLLDYLKDSRSTVSPSGGDIPEAFDVEARLSLPSSWRQTLAEALRLERMPDDVAVAAEYMVGCLDERGYLYETFEEIMEATGVPFDACEEALDILQRVAPPGAGARDLRERLLLCARALPERNEILEKILSRGFDELLQGRFDSLRRKLGLTDEELRDAITALQELAKGAVPLEEGEPAAGVVPDASVIKTDEGWKVVLHDESVPRLRLSPYANNLARQADKLTPEAKDYLMRSLNRAKWMMEALDQRRKTLRRIVEAVVQRQERFFEEGPEALKPLRQEDVAEQLSLHASTVSRAVQEKYIETPHGMFALKAFFPRGVNQSTGGQQARGSVQDQLAALIAGEDPDHPLSDDQIVELLWDQNIKLSRRTVCKYRDELGIPPASRRKGLHKLMNGAKKG